MLNSKKNEEIIDNLSFDRKYRPVTLNDYIGNKILVKTLLSLCNKNQLPHVCLFHGPSGCGKTSVARLLTMEIQCENKVDGRACGVCNNCKRIRENFIMQGKNLPGVTEYDMTYLSKVDDIRDLVQKMRMRPQPPMKKSIYILDEAHRISQEGQNSLLKVCEDTSEFLYIMLCTTEPEKIIPTLRSRARMFSVRKSTVNDVKERLKYIAVNEGIRFEDQALNIIVTNAKRAPREAIKNFELIANVGEVTVENTLSMLQVIDEEIFIEFFDNLDKDIFDIINFIEYLEDRDIEHIDFVKGLSRFVMDCINMKFGIKLEYYTESTYKNARKVFNKFSHKQLIQMLDILEQATRLLANNPSNAELVLKMFALKIGKPEYFVTSPISEDSANGELKRENQVSNINYVKNKKKEKEELLGSALKLNKEATLNDVLAIFGEQGSVVSDKDTEGFKLPSGEDEDIIDEF